LTEEQQAVLHGDGPTTEIEYRLAWARTYLKGMDLLINSRRGVWSLTDRGRTVTQAEIEPLHRAYRTKYNEELRLRHQNQGAVPAGDDDDGADEPGWRDQLLEALVAGMFIWPQIDDQRQRSLVPAGAQTTNTSEAVYVLTAVSA
jgi:restriction system protein